LTIHRTIHPQKVHNHISAANLPGNTKKNLLLCSIFSM